MTPIFEWHVVAIVSGVKTRVSLPDRSNAIAWGLTNADAGTVWEIRKRAIAEETHMVVGLTDVVPANPFKPAPTFAAPVAPGYSVVTVTTAGGTPTAVP